MLKVLGGFGNFAALLLDRLRGLPHSGFGGFRSSAGHVRITRKNAMGSKVAGLRCPPLEEMALADMFR